MNTTVAQLCSSPRPFSKLDVRLGGGVQPEGGVIQAVAGSRGEAPSPPIF